MIGHRINQLNTPQRHFRFYTLLHDSVPDKVYSHFNKHQGGTMHIFSSFTLMIIAGTFFSPLVFAKQNTMGIKAGLNLARPWAANSETSIFPHDAGMKPGVIFGVALRIDGTPIFSMQPELLFSMKGGVVARNGNNVEAMTLSYLEIPVLFRVNIPVERAKPDLYAGPALGLRLSAGGYTRTDNGWDWYTTEYKKTLEESTNPVDFGLAMGGGLEFPTSSGSVVLDVRYTLGLVKIFRLNDYMRMAGWTGDDLVKDKNGVLSVMVGYNFESKDE